MPSGDIDSEISSVSGLAEQEVTFSKTQNSDTEAYLSFSNNEDIDQPVYVVDDSFYNRFENLSFEQSPSRVYSKFQYDEELADCTLRHIKTLRHQGKRSSLKLKEFSKFCIILFNKKFDDVDFMEALSADLGFKDRNQLIDFVNNHESVSAKRGRQMSSAVERQLAYDVWKKNSNLSNDHRNAQHVIKIKPCKPDQAVQDLHDEKATEYQTKGGLKFKAQTHIYGKTVREMYKRFKALHPEINISPTLFYWCKPFYVLPATKREMEGCLCSK